jgi:hypothetical protein
VDIRLLYTAVPDSVSFPGEQFFKLEQTRNDLITWGSVWEMSYCIFVNGRDAIFNLYS